MRNLFKEARKYLFMDHKRLIARHEHAFLADRQGLLEMMLQQFSNPLLAFREMIQNSVDERSPTIDIQAEEVTTRSGKRVYVSIEDTGRGMDLERIHRYLTLFDSTKEDDPTTIGEMGVGKVFVFALKPEYVVVETGTGHEGHKIVINRDFSGRVIPTKARKGTKITTVLHEKVGCLYSMDEIINSLRASCKYVPSTVSINGMPINEDFDIDSPYVIRFDDGTTKAVMALTGNLNHTLSKGGIVLVKGYQKLGRDSFLGNLEILVDSYLFNQPISRNAVNHDENYARVVRMLEKKAIDYTYQLAREFKPKKSSLILKQFLRQVLMDDSAHRRDLAKLPLFETVDNKWVSCSEILKQPHRTLFYASSKLGSNEITYFTQRNIPVLYEPYPKSDNSITRYFKLEWGFGYQGLQQLYFAENFDKDGPDGKFSDFEEQFVKSLYFTALSIRPTFTHRQNSQGTVGGLVEATGYSSGSNSGNPSEQFPSSFNWSNIAYIKLRRFLDLGGNPSEVELLCSVQSGNRSCILLNAEHSYFKSIVKLAKREPTLATYYMLCEVATSRSVFPEADHHVVEDFVDQLGRNLLGVNRG